MTRQNFSKLIFNPFELSDEVLIENASQGKLFSVLGKEEGLMGSITNDQTYLAQQIRYVLYLYDKNSPLWLTDPDIIARKKKAASLAGFDILSDKKTTENLFLLKNVFMARSVSSFIQFQHSNELSVLISNEQVLYELQHVLREELVEFKDDKQKIDHFKTKTDLLEKQDKILGLISKYRDQIWQGDDEAYEQTMEIGFGRKVSPEQIAILEYKTPQMLR